MGAGAELKTPGCWTHPILPAEPLIFFGTWPYSVDRQLTGPRVPELPPRPTGDRTLGQAHAALGEGPVTSGVNLADRAILSPRPAGHSGG